MGRRPEDQPHAEPTTERTPEEILFGQLLTTIQAKFFDNAERRMPVTDGTEKSRRKRIRPETRPYLIWDAIRETVADADPDDLFQAVTHQSSVPIERVSVLRTGAHWKSYDHFRRGVSEEILQYDIFQRFPNLAEENAKRARDPLGI